MNRSFYLTILISVLIHLAIFKPWGEFEIPVVQDTPQPDQKIEISLQQPEPVKPPAPEPTAKPTPKPPEDKPPASKHLEDDIAKANTSDGSSDTPGGKKSRASKQGQAEQQDSQQANIAPPSDAKTPDKDLEALQDIFGQEVEVTNSQDDHSKNQLSEVEEDVLDESNVENPLSKAEEEKARWYNEVLKRVTEQVNYIWVKPEGVDKNTWGVIAMDLDQQGYLLRAWVHLPSGNRALDNSALLAIRGVIRYQVPESSRYYRHLRFNYGGDG
jgi:outer membrane biosynthesis protein TonB